jgi:hypothetical protein
MKEQGGGFGSRIAKFYKDITAEPVKKPKVVDIQF